MLGYFLLFSGGVWITYGLTLILLGFVSMLWVLIDWAGGVHMGPDPNIPEAPTRETDLCWRPHVDSSDVEVMFAPVIDISDTVEIKPADPLTEAAPTEVIDMGHPLFYTIKRPPPPPRLETHTQAWERDGLLARIREAAGEMAP